MAPWKVRVYRVADPETGELLPVEQWRPEGAVGGERLKGASRVVVSDDYALAGCNKASTLAVIDPPGGKGFRKILSDRISCDLSVTVLGCGDQKMAIPAMKPC